MPGTLLVTPSVIIQVIEFFFFKYPITIRTVVYCAVFLVQYKMIKIYPNIGPMIGQLR